MQPLKALDRQGQVLAHAGAQAPAHGAEVGVSELAREPAHSRRGDSHGAADLLEVEQGGAGQVVLVEAGDVELA